MGQEQPIMQELHTNENDSMEEDLPDPLYDLRVDTDGGKFNLHLPGDLMDAQGFYHTMPVSFEPRIEHVDTGVDTSVNPNLDTGKAEVVFRISRIDGYDVDPEYLPDDTEEDADGEEDGDAENDGPTVPFGRRNEMRMWSMHRAGRLSFPLEFATAISVDQGGESVSLFEAASEGDLTADVESPARGVIEVRFNPATVTWNIPDDGRTDVFDYEPTKEWPVTKTPVAYKAGPGVKYDAFRLELPGEFAHEKVLDLDGGELIANRLGQIDGEPVLVFDLDVADDEEDASYVRTLIKSNWIEVDDEQYAQYRAPLSIRWAYALGWDDETELSMEPGEDRFLVAKDGVL